MIAPQSNTKVAYGGAKDGSSSGPTLIDETNWGLNSKALDAGIDRSLHRCLNFRFYKFSDVVAGPGSHFAQCLV